MLPSLITASTWLCRAYFSTLRVSLVTPDGIEIAARKYVSRCEVYALCERDALAVATLLPGRGFTVLVAEGRDGDWAAALCEAFGCVTVRGATNRNGVAALFRVIARMRARGTPVGLTVDGPLGPAGQAKSGAVLCAHRAKVPLIALGAAARYAWVVPGTWSGIYLPLPFTRVNVVLRSVDLPGDDDGSAVTAATAQLTARMAEARAEARRRVGAAST